MRFAITIILLSGSLFLSAPAHAQFEQLFAPILATLNQPRDCPHDNSLAASMDVSLLKDGNVKEATSCDAPMTAPQIDVMAIAAQARGEIASHPVTSPAEILQYDHGGQIGFCFGRALAVHYLLLKAGVDACDIFKIFAMGQLRVHYQMWHFHVAVLIRGPEGSWVVVDPAFADLLPLEIWTEQIQHYDIHYPRPKTQFFVTDPRKFLPASGMYDLETMRRPYLHTYFMRLGHLLQQFDANLGLVDKGV